MRTAHKVWTGIAACVFTVVAISDLSSQQDDTDRAASGLASVDTSTSGGDGTAEAAIGQDSGPPKQPVRTVAKVLDGDTFVVSGTRVRVLGIDSCPLGTYGGTSAKEMAEIYLNGSQVVLRREPGVDRDSHGRALRYVEVDGTDYGSLMVGYDHTGVDENNGASADHLTDLRDADYSGRSCADPAEESTSDTDSTLPYEDDGSVNWPSPGDQGLPDGSLTGGFCARHRWC